MLLVGPKLFSVTFLLVYQFLNLFFDVRIRILGVFDVLPIIRPILVRLWIGVVDRSYDRKGNVEAEFPSFQVISLPAMDHTTILWSVLVEG